jgi:hypothetical protein
MFKVNLAILLLSALLAFTSCSKKVHPDANTGVIESNTEIVKKEPVKVKPKLVIPKVITVNDKVAKRSVDGRYYYDLQGHRYWRNNVDGKYYIFNKSMFTDDAFKAKVN